MNIIECKNLIKTYGNGQAAVKVLDGVNAYVEEGEFVAVMGPSGSGKSTLLYALSGMETVDGGEIIFDGRNIASMTDDKKSRVRSSKMGFVFQQPGMLENLNILDNIILPSVHNDKKRYKEYVAKAKELMKETGIEGLENRGIHEVSGGQLQRAGICRALMNDTKLLFADEPTGALDTKTTEEVLDLIEKVHKKGTAIFMVTHDPKVAARADRIINFV